LNRLPSLFRPLAGTLTLAVAACLSVSLSGCTGEKTFAKVNGQVITEKEYLHSLERQQVTVSQGQSTSAERLVLDQLIGNRIILAEAAKLDCLPKESDITAVYNVQKKLWEAQLPGKEYEKTMAEQGATPEDIKSDIKVTLAEANIFAKKLDLKEEEVKTIYSQARGQFGLPERVQLRFILTQANSPQFQQTKQLLAQGKDFVEVAKTTNPPQLRGTGGLEPQTRPVASFASVIQAQIKKTPEGKFFGPVPFALGQNQPPAQAWVKIEKKMPALALSYEEAQPLVRRQLAQVRVLQPENAKVRQQLIDLKLDAKFEAQQKEYNTVWSAYKDQAKQAGLGANPTAPTTPTTAIPK